MTRPTPEELLAFLEGRLERADRERLLDRLAADQDLAREFRAAAAGMALVEPLGGTAPPLPAPVAAARRIRWGPLLAAAAVLLLAVPVGYRILVRQTDAAVTATAPDPILPPSLAGRPEPGYVLVLHGRWPDAGRIDPAETTRRAREYWAWTATLADDAILLAAGDLRWEPGQRLGPGAVPAAAGDQIDSPDFVVGMLALRVDTEAEALALARQCPHLKYGGSVSVRRVARGFLTPGRSGT
ncbi:MAG: YciI family protein [Gemmatimonadales bacterium]